MLQGNFTIRSGLINECQLVPMQFFFFSSFNYYYFFFFIVHLLLLKELQITCYALFSDWNYGRHLLLWLCTQTINKTWERTPASPSLYQPELLQYCHLLPWLTQVHQAQLSYWSSNAARCDLFCTTRIHASALASATTTDPPSAVLCLVTQGTRSCLNFTFKRWKYFDKLLSQRSKIRRALRKRETPLSHRAAIGMSWQNFSSKSIFSLLLHGFVLREVSLWCCQQHLASTNNVF